MNDKLANYDYVVMIDKSGSMGTTDCPGGKMRWTFAQEYAESIAREADKFDSNGIDIVVFAGTSRLYSNVTAEKVKDVFAENSPAGSTDTAGALKLVFDEYKKKKAIGQAKPLIVICVTDGEPNDRGAVAHQIVDFSKTLNDDSDCGITFVQIGKDAAARNYLKQLDNDLQPLGAKFDIVDTRDFEEMEQISIVDVLVQAVLD